MASNETSKGRFDVFKFVPADLEIITDPADPLYDERINLPLAPEFVANIRYHGVLEPVLVTRRGVRADGNPRMIVIAGRQRVRAAHEANKQLKAEGQPELLVPTIVKRGDDAAMAEISISENEARQGDSPIVRAQKMQRLLDCGRTPADVARSFCCSVASVKLSLGLLETAPEVQAAVHAGKVSAAAVRSEVAKLPHEEQVAKLKEVVATTKATKGGKGTPRRTTSKAKVAAKAETVVKKMGLVGRQTGNRLADLIAARAKSADALIVAQTIRYMISGDIEQLPKWAQKYVPEATGETEAAEAAE